MASSSGPEQPSGPDPGSVLCDKCKKSVLDPSQSTDDVSFPDRMQQALKDWLLSPKMWPVGYVIASSYSPFRVEQELPKRDWRDAFEDLLALESGNNIISHESRKQETAVAAKIRWERANYLIENMNKLNMRDSPILNRGQTALDEMRASGNRADLSVISWLDKNLKVGKETVLHRVALARWFKAWEEDRREWSASSHRDRGQWIASLVTSGALRGWFSVLQDSEVGDLIQFIKEEDQEILSSVLTSERELAEHFEEGKPLHTGTPGPPLYRVSRRPPTMPEKNPQILHEDSGPEIPPDEPELWSRVPERPCFWRQIMAAEQITLPIGKTVTKVVMRNWLTNGDVEEKVMIQEPGKVLQEVEKARAMIENRRLGLDSA